MKDTTLYEHLLGLKTPWSVKSVDLSLTDQRVAVEVVLKPSQVWADPTDSTRRAHINGCPTTQGVCDLTRLAWSTVNGIMTKSLRPPANRRGHQTVNSSIILMDEATQQNAALVEEAAAAAEAMQEQAGLLMQAVRIFKLEENRAASRVSTRLAVQI